MAKQTPFMQKFQRLTWNSPLSGRVEGPFVLFHGGLGDQLADRQSLLSSLTKIASRIQRRLRSSSAVDMCVEAVNELENDPTFNAGYGARLQQDGIARLSSAVMDGGLQHMASVSNILSQKHPSKIARDLLLEKDRNLSSFEANAFAYKSGYVPTSVLTPLRFKEWRDRLHGKTGTVGAVALDQKSRPAACTSTGGRGFETPGRVSDSFTPAGNFANPFGAISCTGVGEEILDAAVASTIGARLEDGWFLTEAIARTYQRHQRCYFGSISLDARGHACVYATRGAMSFGLVTKKNFFVGLLPSDWHTITKKL